MVGAAFFAFGGGAVSVSALSCGAVGSPGFCLIVALRIRHRFGGTHRITARRRPAVCRNPGRTPPLAVRRR